MKQKLTSRKLWVAITGVIAGVVLIAVGNKVEGTTTLVASILGYLAAEGLIDAKAVNNQLKQTDNENTEE